MAQQDGFTGGLQFGLSVFNALQNASYLQGLQQDRAENQEMRRQELAMKQQAMEAEAEKREMGMHEFIVTHPEAVGKQAVMNSYNYINRKLAGPNARPLNELQIDTWEKRLNEAPELLANAPDEQSRLSIMTQLEAESAESPLHSRSFAQRKPVFERIGAEKGFYEAMRAAHRDTFSDEQLKDWGAKLPTKELTRIIEDKDYRAMFTLQNAERRWAGFLSGEEKMSPRAVQDTAATIRLLGGNLGTKAQELLKTRDNYEMLNQQGRTVKSLQDRMKPLFDLVRLAEPEIAKLDSNDRSYAFRLTSYKETGDGTYDSPSLARFAGANPNIMNQIQKDMPAALDNLKQLERRLTEKKNEFEAALNDPNMPSRESWLNVFQQEMDGIELEMKPYKAFAAYNRDPSVDNLKGILDLEKELDRAYKKIDASRHDALNADQRNAEQITQQKWIEANTTRATHDAQMRLNQEIAAHPEWEETDIRGASARIAADVQKEYGVTPDMNRVQDNVISKKSQVTSLTASQQTAVAEAEQSISVADSLLNDFDPSYVGSFDNMANKWKAMLPEGAPEWMKLPPKVQEYRQRAELFLTQYRNQMFGASLSKNEQSSALAAMANLDMGDEQFKAALKEMKKWSQKAVEANKKAANKSFQKSPAEDPYKGGDKLSGSFDDFKSWYQKNKNKFASPDEAARAYRQGG